MLDPQVTSYQPEFTAFEYNTGGSEESIPSSEALVAAAAAAQSEAKTAAWRPARRKGGRG
jgi:hypothetical protein